MSLIGSLMVKIGADNSGLQKGLSGAKDAVSKFGGGIVGVGTTAVKTTAVIGAAFAGATTVLATKSLADFATFEQGMNEVFTLIPGTTKKAMDAMTEDVKNFAKEFGVLPDKVVPALYSSLSAGVPADNVFSFLETAQKMAKGGVTELETAVDGLSSVVNAYGIDNLSTEKASDLMFTAIKAGKTTADELAGSLFNVIPTASSLGVEFGDVTAAIAQMTAMGTPTSVATTQMRQMLVELSKSGTTTSDAFKQLSGKSFVDFVKEGGNVQQALAILQTGAEDSGLRMSDMFGSVEAGNAALALSGDNAEKYASLIDQMADSAGATDAAYAQMDKGIMSSMNRIKATAKVALLDLGDSLAPGAEKAINGFLDIMSGRAGGAEKLAAGANELINTLMTGMINALPQIIQAGMSIIQSLVDGIIDNAPLIIENMIMLINGLADIILQNAEVVLAAFMQLMGALVILLVERLPEFVQLGMDMLISVATGIAESLPEMIPAIIAMLDKIVTIIIENLPTLLTAALEIIIALAEGLAESLPELIPQIIEIVMTIIDTLIANLDKLINAALQIVLALIIGLADALPKLIKYIPTIVNTIIRVLIDNLPMLIQAAVQIIFAIITGLIQAIPALIAYIPELGKAIVNAFKDTDWNQIGKDIINGIVKGFNSMKNALGDAAKNAANGALSSIKKSLGIASPSKVFRDQVGKMIPRGMAIGIEADTSLVDKAISGMMSVPESQSITGMTVQQSTLSTPESTRQEDTPSLLKELIDLIRNQDRAQIMLDGQPIGEAVLSPLMRAATRQDKAWPVGVR